MRRKLPLVPLMALAIGTAGCDLNAATECEGRPETYKVQTIPEKKIKAYLDTDNNATTLWEDLRTKIAQDDRMHPSSAIIDGTYRYSDDIPEWKANNLLAAFLDRANQETGISSHVDPDDTLLATDTPQLTVFVCNTPQEKNS